MKARGDSPYSDPNFASLGLLSDPHRSWQMVQFNGTVVGFIGIVTKLITVVLAFPDKGRVPSFSCLLASMGWRCLVADLLADLPQSHALPRMPALSDVRRALRITLSSVHRWPAC
jgi:hypothetical protein